MHLLHRPSMFGGGRSDGSAAPLRRVGGSPRAPQARHLLARSDSIKKRSGGTNKGSKRARLRAGLAAALHELRLATGHRHHRRGPPSPESADVQASSFPAAAAAYDAPARATAGTEEPAAGGVARTPAPALLLLALLALACVVALGRAPAVCCCTCGAAWLSCCGRPPAAAATGGRRRNSALCGGVALARSGNASTSSNSYAARSGR